MLVGQGTNVVRSVWPLNTFSTMLRAVSVSRFPGVDNSAFVASATIGGLFEHDGGTFSLTAVRS